MSLHVSEYEGFKKAVMFYEFLILPTFWKNIIFDFFLIYLLIKFSETLSTYSNYIHECLQLKNTKFAIVVMGNAAIFLKYQ